MEEVLAHLNDAIYHIETAIASLNSAGEQDIARMLEFVKELAASAEDQRRIGSGQRKRTERTGHAV